MVTTRLPSSQQEFGRVSSLPEMEKRSNSTQAFLCIFCNLRSERCNSSLVKASISDQDHSVSGSSLESSHLTHCHWQQRHRRMEKMAPGWAAFHHLRRLCVFVTLHLVAHSVSSLLLDEQVPEEFKTQHKYPNLVWLNKKEL